MKHQEPHDTGDRLRSPENKLEKATLGGGCFWCLEAPFEQLEGVVEVISGYAGGHTPDPTYGEVSSGTTGHAEVVRVEFDPAILPFRDLLRIFFSMHDPTTQDRQGVDIGPEYRSIILFHSENQREIAEQVIEELDSDDIWDDPIVTEIAPLTTFYPAEDYHQEYYRRNSGAGYCRMVIDPKMEKLRKEFSSRLKQVPVQ